MASVCPFTNLNFQWEGGRGSCFSRKSNNLWLVARFPPCTRQTPRENSWEQTASLCDHTQSSHILHNHQDLALRAAVAVPLADVAECVQLPLQEVWHGDLAEPVQCRHLSRSLIHAYKTVALPPPTKLFLHVLRYETRVSQQTITSTVMWIGLPTQICSPGKRSGEVWPPGEGMEVSLSATCAYVELRGVGFSCIL